MGSSHSRDVKTNYSDPAVLFHRTQDPDRTQDSGRRTTGPGPDLNMLIFQGEIPSAAYCRYYQIKFTIRSNSLSPIDLSRDHVSSIETSHW